MFYFSSMSEALKYLCYCISQRTYAHGILLFTLILMRLYYQLPVDSWLIYPQLVFLYNNTIHARPCPYQNMAKRELSAGFLRHNLHVNSLDPGRGGNTFKSIYFKVILENITLIMSYEITLM